METVLTRRGGNTARNLSALRGVDFCEDKVGSGREGKRIGFCTSWSSDWIVGSFTGTNPSFPLAADDDAVRRCFPGVADFEVWPETDLEIG